MAFKLVAFDLDDTLWGTKDVLDRAQENTYRWLCEHAPWFENSSVEALETRRKALLDPAIAPALQLDHSRRQAIASIAQELGFDRDAAAQLGELGLAAFLKFRNDVRPFEGAERLLATIAADSRIVAISNGNSDVFETPLGKYFSAHYKAQVTGSAKPEPTMLIEAQGSLPASDCVLIGDSDKYDASAALAAKWAFIRLAPGDTEGVINVAEVIRQLRDIR